MTTVTQTMRYRQALIKYAEKYGVTKAAIRYKTNRQYIYRWKNRYDGTLQSLADKSHRPHHHPNQHTEAELKLIADMRRRNPHAGLVVFWVKLMQRGYTRSITGLYRVLRRQGDMAVKPPNPKYIAKPYEQMNYPGQRVQIDVKFVPEACIVGDAAGQKFYQYTAIDEYSRFRYIEAFEEHSTYSSAVFLKNLLTDKAGIRNTLFIKIATTAPTAKRTNADEHTKANIPSLPQAFNADCRYSSFAPGPVFFLPALSALALSRILGFFDTTELKSCVICCGVKLRKHTIAIMRNIDAIIGSIIRNQLPSLRICLVPPVVHRTAGVFF